MENIEIRFRHFEDVDQTALSLKDCETTLIKKLSFMEKYVKQGSAIKVKVKMTKRVDGNLTNLDNEYSLSVQCTLKTGDDMTFRFTGKGLVNVIHSARSMVKENILQAMNKNQKKVSRKRAAKRTIRELTYQNAAA